MIEKKINLDMDGTIVDFYGVEGWLEDLENERARPYIEAKPLVNLSLLARMLNKLQLIGYEINIVSWTSKDSSDEFHHTVIEAKQIWLENHMPSVRWNNIYIVEYGTPKQDVSTGYLFDDEEANRTAWGEGAMDAEKLIENLKKILKST